MYRTLYSVQCHCIVLYAFPLPHPPTPPPGGNQSWAVGGMWRVGAASGGSWGWGGWGRGQAPVCSTHYIKRIALKGQSNEILDPIFFIIGASLSQWPTGKNIFVFGFVFAEMFVYLILVSKNWLPGVWYPRESKKKLILEQWCKNKKCSPLNVY